MASRPLRLLMVGGHPADCFDQAGGTLAHHAARGDQITAVTLTTGVRSHHWRLREKRREKQESLDVEQEIKEAIRQKIEETREACRILGFDDLRTLNFEDDDILLTREMVEALADVIRDVCPDVIITHHPYEMAGLKMHGTTGQAVLYAWQQAMGIGRDRDKTHIAAAVFFMNPMGYMGNNTLGYASTSRVDLVVDITDVVEKKVKAMDLINTQYYAGAYARKCHEISDGATGGLAYVAYGEAFQSLYPRACYTLPVSDADLLRTSQPAMEGMARRSEIVAALMPLPPGEEFTAKFRFTKEMYDS